MSDDPIIVFLERNLEASEVFSGLLHSKRGNAPGGQILFGAVDFHQSAFAGKVDDDASPGGLGSECTVDGKVAVGSTDGVLWVEYEQGFPPARIKVEHGDDFGGIVFG